jgi:DtxR family Mn-dependent transcriptional regulator
LPLVDASSGRANRAGLQVASSVQENDAVSDLIDTTEMYLRTIFELEEEGIVPLRARIAERLGHSGPTVSQTVARMERDGLVHVSGDRHLELTDAGRAKATRVMRKHRLAERLLLDVIGLEWELVHDEACRWEHVMSDHVEQKLVQMLKDPLESPYGNPIPGLDEVGGAPDAEQRVGVLSLPDALSGPVRPAENGLLVRRLGERLQMDGDLMRRLSDAGVLPGRTVTAARTATGYQVTVVGPRRPAVDGAVGVVEVVDGVEGVQLLADVARHVFVQAV